MGCPLLIVKGLMIYLAETAALIWCIRTIPINQPAINYLNILTTTRPDVAACCNVYSQGTVMLGQAWRKAQKAGKVYAVGSDLPDVTAERSGAPCLTM